jgi:hypothetical protein
MADYWAGGQGLEQSAEMVSDGAGALKLNLLTSGTAWEEGGVYVDPATPLDLSAATYVTADVYVPAEATNFIGQIFVKTGEEWTWANSADTALTPGEWTTIRADLSTLGNAADVREIGVKVGSGSTAFEGAIFIDNLAIETVLNAPEPVAVETTSETLHSFEADVEGWVMADYWAGGQGLEQSADMATDGAGALKLNLLTSGTAWEEGGVYVDLATPLDLSAATYVTADVYVPAEAANFIGQIFVKTGEEWIWANTADTALTPGEWTTITGDLSTLGNIADVREIGVKVGSGSTAFEGPIYIDNIAVVAEVAAAEAPAVETASESLHSFEADVEGWVMADYWAGGQGLEQSADMASDGAGALKLNLLTSGTAWEEGGVYVDPATPLDLSSAVSITADVYVPAEATNFLAQIFVKTGEEWTWANTADTALTPGEWTTVTADLSTLGNSADVREIGVKVGSGSTAFEGPIYIDNITVVSPVN